jgi:pyruvate/2-oxoglutarate dehydrogenase complex dihydrolipoamide acyltransferase (E2) component
MIISLSYDHRLMDGLEALKFLNHVKKYIQEPELLGLE